MLNEFTEAPKKWIVEEKKTLGYICLIVVIGSMLFTKCIVMTTSALGPFGLNLGQF